jgi:hypothetical protein
MNKFKGKFYSAIYALTSGVYISLVGRLMFSEVLSLVFVPFLSLKKIFKSYKGLGVVIKLLFGLLLSQMLSDFINGTEVEYFLKGWSTFIVAMFSIIFLVNYLSKDKKAVLYFLLFAFLAKLLLGSSDLGFSDLSRDDNFFKARVVGFLNPLIIFISSLVLLKNKKKLSINLLFLYAMVCVVLGARSNGLVFLFSALLLYIKLFNLSFKKAQVIRLSLFVSVIFYISYVYYVDKVLNDGFGGVNAISQLNEASNPYNPFELLYLGRPENVVAFKAIMERPFLGQGSWAQDEGFKYAEMLAELFDKRVSYHRTAIPSHAIFLTAWLWSGVLGLIFVTSIFYYLFKAFIKQYKNSDLDFILLISTVTSINMLWHFLFSPYGHLRTTLPFFAAIIIINQNKYYFLKHSK